MLLLLRFICAVYLNVDDVQTGEQNQRHQYRADEFQNGKDDFEDTFIGQGAVIGQGCLEARPTPHPGRENGDQQAAHGQQDIG